MKDKSPHQLQQKQAQIDDQQIRKQVGSKIIRNLINLRLRKVMQHMKDNNYQTKIKKIASLRIYNIIRRSYQLNGFQQIKSHKSFNTDHRQNDHHNSNTGDLQSKILQQLKGHKDARSICEFIRNNTSIIGHNSERHKKLILLQINNKILSIQNAQLKQDNDALNKRMIKENSKKKESLEMLAEELEQKNQVIQDLKKCLAHFQQKYHTDSSILEDQVSSLRKQVHDNAYIRQRLENDLERTRLELSQTTEKLIKITNIAHQNQKLLERLEAQKIQQMQRNSKLQCMDGELSKLLKNLKSKYKHISTQFQQTIKQSENPEILAKFLQSESSLKLKIILNIMDDPLMASQLNTVQIFTIPERQIIKKYRDRMQNDESNHPRLEEKDVEISGIVGRGLNEVDQNYHNTIFQILDNHHEDAHTKQNSKTDEFEQEKNRLYQQISEVKRKILNIRSLILEFLKTINIQVGKKTSSEASLEMILEVFQYSEEQRESIFSRKKNGFIFF